MQIIYRNNTIHFIHKIINYYIHNHINYTSIILSCTNKFFSTDPIEFSAIVIMR